MPQCLNLAGPPQYVGDGRSRQIARVNHTKKLLCPVEGDPFPFIEWKKDGESINELWDNHKVMKDGSLRIKDIEVENAGKYVCKATNGFGSISVNYTLVVVGKLIVFWKILSMQRENGMFPATFSLEVKMEIKHSIFIDWSCSWNSLHNSVIAIKLKKKDWQVANINSSRLSNFQSLNLDLKTIWKLILIFQKQIVYKQLNLMLCVSRLLLESICLGFKDI